MATTVQEFINLLQAIENKDQPVIGVFYTATDFVFDDENLTVAQFEKVVENVDKDYLFDDVFEEICLAVDDALAGTEVEES